MATIDNIETYNGIAEQMKHGNHTVKRKYNILVFHKNGRLERIPFGKRSKRNMGKGLI